MRRDFAMCVSHYFRLPRSTLQVSAGQRWGYAKASLLGCVLMRQLCRDEKNTHRATQETSAGLPKVIPLNEKQTAC